MLESSARSTGTRRVAALLASLSIVALLALAAHAHGEVRTDSSGCEICAVAHHSAAPIPTQPQVAAAPPQILRAGPLAPVVVARHFGALPIARAPPTAAPNS